MCTGSAPSDVTEGHVSQWKSNKLCSQNNSKGNCEENTRIQCARFIRQWNAFIGASAFCFQRVVKCDPVHVLDTLIAFLIEPVNYLESIVCSKWIPWGGRNH
ncbi:hypothetical protein CEXT_136991 [Caerostris extrusa]|uniref:Uncharacterized protein n=1 Tax=Caerostris extrusa TaxID=172846 RepID=A0AAV4NYC1_CAEEX|nr:hypothetical protein CEXT_136991 [Caerostris extrusa]